MLVSRIRAFHIRFAMIRGCIAIPEVDPKRWRAKSRKRKPAQTVPSIIEGVKSPQEIKRERHRKRLMGEG